jgi:hypothetical protein
MQPARVMTPDTLRLSEGVSLACDWQADLYTLISPHGAIPLNRTAATVLALCDVGVTRNDLIARVARGDATQAQHIEAFVAAAQRRNWITSASSR